MNPNHLSRRQLLATGGVASVFGLTTWLFGVVDSGDVEHNQQLRLQQSDVDLVVNWAEWYNGTKLEAQASPTDANGPIVTLSNVLPGDSGRLHFGLSLDEGSAVDSTALSMQLQAPDDSFDENGLTEPERKAPDSSTDTGELQEFIQVRVWYDVGITLEGSEIAGRCDGDFDTGETVIAEGTLAAVSDTLADWTPLDARPGTGGRDCLGTDQELCIGIDWSFEGDPGDPNVTQSDSVDFLIGFLAEQCSTT